MAFIEFDEVSKHYPGAAAPAVDRLRLSIEQGEFLTLLGPSGSGKTTTLMMLAGFEPVSSGTIRLQGQPIEQLPAHRRGMGVVFQSYSLFPHMTVAENVAFPLKVRKVGASEIEQRVREALGRVRLQAYADRRPQQLSGGQQQRVALARALVFNPALVLMDEPLAALDKRLREELQLEIRRLHRELGVTMVFVTHDQGEAMTLSDRVAVFHQGRIEQLGGPQTLYDQPASPFVAGFIGDNHPLTGHWLGLEADTGLARIAGPQGPLRARCCAALRQACTGAAAGGPPTHALLCIRPERLHLLPQGTAAGAGAGTGAGPATDNDRAQSNSLTGTLADLIHQGDHWRLIVQLDQPAGAGPSTAQIRPQPACPPWVVKLPPAQLPPGLAPGQHIRLGFRPDDAWAFAPDGPDSPHP
jgi:putative spermidine/putrescine transport system ATP-binding protein